MTGLSQTHSPPRRPLPPPYATLTVARDALQRNHAVGECVSNIVPGNPGPQLGFDVNFDRYKAVVPHWSRIP